MVAIEQRIKVQIVDWQIFFSNSHRQNQITHGIHESIFGVDPMYAAGLVGIVTRRRVVFKKLGV